MSLNHATQISDDIYYLQNKKAVVEFADGVQNNDVSDGPKTTTSKTVSKIGGYEVAKWGYNNQKPAEMLKLIRENHIKPGLLRTERDFLMGSRLCLFTSRLEKGKHIIEHAEDEEMTEWADAVDLATYWFKVCSNWVDFANVANYATLDSSKKVDFLDVIDCDQIRKEVFVNGEVKRCFVHPDWRGNPSPSDIKVIRTFDRKNPTKLIEFVDWVMEAVPGQRYYAYPAWWGTEEWTKISNKIPKFHNSGLDNGYNIKYKIKVPWEYVLKLTGNNEDPEKVKQAKESITTEMDRWLSGVKNVNKAMIMFAFKDAQGREIAGWEIEPMDNKSVDDKYVELDKHANQNQASGHMIDPALAGIDTGSGLGKSGSEIRLTYDVHVALRTTQPREKCLKFLNKVVIPLMGWKKKGIFWGVEDVQMTTLDKNPAGKQEVVNQGMNGG
jgi:hypothetical protein